MMTISLNDCHLPDEYIDSAIWFATETRENRELPSSKEILTSIFPFHWLGSNKEATEEDFHAINDLNECHLPEEYVDASVLCYYNDDDDTSESERPPSAKDILRYVVPFRWLRCNDDSTKKLPEEPSATSGMTLNECHFPDEYVDAIVSYYPSDSEASSPIEDFIASIITFAGHANNGNATEKPCPATGDIFLNDCHLPDDYVDAVISAYGKDPSERSKDQSVRNESRRNAKHPWVGDEASKAEKDDNHALKRPPISRDALQRRRKSTQSVSRSAQ
jgi:hypothetical protein